MFSLKFQKKEPAVSQKCQILMNDYQISIVHLFIYVNIVR